MKKGFFVIVLILSVLLSGCAKAAATPSTQELYTDKSGGQSSLPGVPLGAPAMEAPRAADGSTSNSGDFGNASSVNLPQKQMIIMNADLVIIVDDTAKAVDDILNLTKSMGGNLIGSQLYKSTTSSGEQVPEASISISVPSEKLNEVLAKIKGMVKDTKTDIVNENLSSQNVTKEYVDLESRLKNLEDTEAQLRKIMETGTKVEDVMMVFNQLTQVREQIEIVKGQMKYYEQSSAMSTLNIRLVARETTKPITVAGWKPTGVALDAVQALLDGLKFLANVLIWGVIFFLPIGLVLYVVVRLLIKLFRKLFPPRPKLAPYPVYPPAPPAEPPAAPQV